MSDKGNPPLIKISELSYIFGLKQAHKSQNSHQLS